MLHMLLTFRSTSYNDKMVPDSKTSELDGRNRELAILNEIASALNQEVNLHDALKTALEKVARLLGLRTGWIWLLRENDERKSYLAAAQNLPPALESDPQLLEGDCYCLRTFRAGDLAGAANVNVVSCSRLNNLVDGTGGLRYHTSVPLYASHGLKLGVLNVADTSWRELSAADLQLLHTIGDLLGITIERARHFARSAQIGAAEERNRLAREIHDTLAQNLAAITLQMETADALLETGAPTEQVWTAVRTALSLSRDGLHEARRSVLDLRAAPLEGRTLAGAIRTLAHDFQERSGIKVELHLLGADHPLPSRLEVGIFRILQEALANIERHAAAQQVTVELQVMADAIQLSVRDDGRGFDPEAAPSGRYGLIGISERVHLLGGHLELRSSPGEGTDLSAAFSLSEVT